MSPLPRDKSLWFGGEGDLHRCAWAVNSHLSSLWDPGNSPVILGEAEVSQSEETSVATPEINREIPKDPKGSAGCLRPA